MLRTHTQLPSLLPRRIAAFALLLICLTGGLFPSARVQAMIRGGEGNKPLADPGWPTGAAAVFNSPSRIAWWEDPPFGGGQWHAECKGDAEILNQVLQDFQKIDASAKRLVVVDGIGFSFWLDPNRERRADRSTKIDWVFTIWQQDRWQLQKDLPEGLSAISKNGDADAPIPEIRVYAAAFRWSDVVIPKGIEVVDQRLQARGFQLSDGRVIEGGVTDADSGQPLQCTIHVERITPKPAGGYDYQRELATTTDTQGRWVIKGFNDQWSRLIAERDGYAPRVICYVHYDLQPGWEQVNTSLAQQATISGRVLDEKDQPIEGASVRLRDVRVQQPGAYELLNDPVVKTDQDGVFSMPGLPRGKAKLKVYRAGYFMPGMGQAVSIPDENIALQMQSAATLAVLVTFAQPRGEQGYIVELTPEGGEKVGSWSGSANLDANDRVVFRAVPPGRYTLTGRPNPGSLQQQTKDLLVVLEGGHEILVKLEAR